MNQNRLNGHAGGQALAYIHDGYNRSAFIAAVPRLYPAVRFTYRPMLSANRAVISDQIAKSDPRKGETIAANVITNHVSAWDIQDHEGKTVEIAPDHVLRLQPRLLARLFQVVIGNLAPDEDPDAADAANSEAAERELAAALAGVSVEDHDAKN